jgi:gluconokinase
VRFIHLHGDPALLALRVSQRQGHYMPPTLLASQLNTLEIPSLNEAVLSLDIAEPAERLVAKIEQQLHLNPA